MLCSVIILNWNGEKWLRRFLPSVVENTTDKDVEIVVADNGSTDGSLELVKSTFPNVRLICFSENYGFAEGYNKAIKEVQSEFVVLLNSDVETPKHWLEPLLDFLKKNKNFVACQPMILSYNDKSRFEYAGAAGGQLDFLGYAFCRGRKFGNVLTDNNQYPTAEVFWASGACLCCRRKEYIEAGGLDCDFFAHMEEIDLCWRWHLSGYNVACVTESKVYHVGGGSLSYGNPRKTFLNFRNNLLMLYKNLPMWRLCYVMPLRFLLDYLAMFFFCVNGNFRSALQIPKARLAFWKLLKIFRQKRKSIREKAVVSYPKSISSVPVFFAKI
ncbi:MAG: glycosyltransferase family 2 protein [Paludibacteraceae bacterium]|nr:glycosyltransferase family 2 protein [Paludibacteraceae bacterium]